MRPITVLLSVFLLLFLLPDSAYAWGFGVHLQLGNQILGQMALLPASLQKVLSTFSADFLYGCISADITLGKKYTHHLKHCHSWNVGEQILQQAGSDAQRACAYGYLSHLAADTIAHSYMVPFKMIRSYNTVMLNHVYWELRFEAQIPAQVWHEARLLAKHDFSADDQLLSSVLANTLFSFGTNKQLFNSMLLVSRIKRWRKLLAVVDKRSRWAVSPEERQEYLTLALQAAMSILNDPFSPYLNADPTGERALHVALQLRNNLKALWLDGKLQSTQSALLINELKGEFRAAITQPQLLLRLITDQH